VQFRVQQKLLACVTVVLFWQLMGRNANAADHWVNPANLGKGDWIYILNQAINQLGGGVPGVTNLSSLMIHEKNQGMQYLIIKAGDGDQLFPSAANPQFTSNVVSAAHAAGLKVFGYNRSFGHNIPGEIAIADYVFNVGADGFVIDAESEWESQNLPHNAALAIRLCQGIRTNWPDKFLAHSPFAYIHAHKSFPYKEFGYYCDAVMPQAYWIEFGESPSVTAYRMNTNWVGWQNGLTDIWTNSIKPIVPVGQGWNGSGTITASQIAEFVAALNNNPNPATTGGYQGVNWWRAELHPAKILDALRTNSVGNIPTNTPVISNVSLISASDVSATISWTSDQSSDSVVDYGLTTSCESSVTNSAFAYYHTVTIYDLNPDTTYHFRVRSKNASGLECVSAGSTLTTLAVSVADIIIDNPSAAVFGTWTNGTVSTDEYGTNYLFRSTRGSGTNYVQYTPTISTPGNYRIYEWHPQGNQRATDSPHVVQHQGGTQIVPVNQTVNGGQWNLLGTYALTAGTNSNVKITDAYASGLAGNPSTNVMADAIKFVYVAPLPSPPVIITQPQDQNVNFGSPAAFAVEVRGTAPLQYQWCLNGSEIPGATASTYHKSNVQPPDAGDYSVRITNSIGAVSSSNAVLIVHVPANIPSHLQSGKVMP